MSKYFAEKNFMTVVMNQKNVPPIIHKNYKFGNQYNGIRFAIWELVLKH